jgi:hypothetical protein
MNSPYIANVSIRRLTFDVTNILNGVLAYKCTTIGHATPKVTRKKVTAFAQKLANRKALIAANATTAESDVSLNTEFDFMPLRFETETAR